MPLVVPSDELVEGPEAVLGLSLVNSFTTLLGVAFETSLRVPVQATDIHVEVVDHFEGVVLALDELDLDMVDFEFLVRLRSTARGRIVTFLNGLLEQNPAALDTLDAIVHSWVVDRGTLILEELGSIHALVYIDVHVAVGRERVGRILEMDSESSSDHAL
jgi:hypothetical protein